MTDELDGIAQNNGTFSYMPHQNGCCTNCYNRHFTDWKYLNCDCWCHKSIKNVKVSKYG